MVSFNLGLKLIQQHVRDTVCDGEQTTGLWTLEVAFDYVDLKQDMVEFLKHLVIRAVLFRELAGQAIHTDLFGHCAHGAPV